MAMKGLLGLAVVMGGVTLILSFVFGLSLMTALGVLLLIVFAPVLGILIMMMLPVHPIIRSIVGLSVSIALIIYGLSWLGVV